MIQFFKELYLTGFLSVLGLGCQSDLVAAGNPLLTPVKELPVSPQLRL